jgi:hypothetical protein
MAQRLPVNVDRLPRLPSLLQHVPEVVQHLNPVRPQRNGRAIGGDRFGAAADLLQDLAQYAEAVGVRRVDPRGPRKDVRRVIEVAGRRGDAAEEVKRDGVIRLGPEDLAVDPLGLGEATVAVVGDGGVEQVVSHAWVRFADSSIGVNGRQLVSTGVNRCQPRPRRMCRDVPRWVRSGPARYRWQIRGPFGTFWHVWVAVGSFCAVAILETWRDIWGHSGTVSSVARGHLGTLTLFPQQRAPARGEAGRT